MSYIPKPGDAAMDLQRCITLSFDGSKFSDKSYKEFFENAVRIISSVKTQIKPNTYKTIKNRLQKASDTKNSEHKRREDLLMAATLLMLS